MDNQPLVSIACITYNHEKYIAQAIESFLMQKTSFSYEILIHDDASTDSTQSIIRKYEKDNSTVIRAVYQTENQNSQGKSSFVPLFQMAKGKYIAICEGDDYWTDENKLALQVEIMESHPECSGCCHNTRAVNEQGCPHEGDMQLIHYKSEDIILDKTYLNANCRFCRTPSLMIRTSVMPRTKSDWENYSACRANGDMKWSAIIAATGNMYFLARTLADYRYVLTTGSGSWNARNKDKNINLRVFNSLENIKQYILSEYHNELCYDGYYVWLVLNSIKQFAKKHTKENWYILKSLLQITAKRGILIPGIYRYAIRKVKKGK